MSAASAGNDLLDLKGSAAAHEPAEVFIDLSPYRIPTEKNACKRDHDNQYRTQREQGIIGEGGAELERIIVCKCPGRMSQQFPTGSYKFHLAGFMFRLAAFFQLLKDNKLKKPESMRSILYLLAVIFIIGWLLGVFVWSATGLIHVLIVLAVISILLAIIRRA